jgi:hypothetical protein
MNSSDPALHHSGVDYRQEIDGALAILAAVQPRDGLEQRILTHIAAAPELPWYRRFAAVSVGHHRWALAAASAVIVAGSVTMTTYRHHSVPVPIPVAVHIPHAVPQAAAAAASVGVSDHPLEKNKATARHRGVHKSYRAIHERVPLPRGTAAPMRPNATPVTQ